MSGALPRRWPWRCGPNSSGRASCGRNGSDRQHTVVFAVKRQDERIVFTVTDDGIGMDAETKARLFDLFYSTKGQKGTGFGLFIAQKIVSQHGGDILVASSPGKGAAFTVRIPVADWKPEAGNLKLET